VNPITGIIYTTFAEGDSRTNIGDVIAFNGADNTDGTVGSVPVHALAFAIAVNPVTQKLCVTSPDGGSVIEVD
jgi:hypothetical protein